MNEPRLAAVLRLDRLYAGRSLSTDFSSCPRFLPLTALPQLGAGEYLNHVFLGWGLQDVQRGKILSLWIGRVSNALSSFGEVVGFMPKLNVGSKQEPVGAWFAKRHSHTAGVHNSSPSVSVAAKECASLAGRRAPVL